MATRRPDDDGPSPKPGAPPARDGSFGGREDEDPQVSWLSDLPLDIPGPVAEEPAGRPPSPPRREPASRRQENLSLFEEPSAAALPSEVPDGPSLDRLPEIEGLLGEPPRRSPEEVREPPLGNETVREEGEPPSPALEVAPEADEEVEDLETAPHRGATLAQRWLAGLLDLGVHLTVASLVVLGSWLLGAEPTVAAWAPLGLFLLVFSFLYTVIPLAFWGRTPGMTRAGIYAAHGDREPLTFGQTGVRWVASLFSLALLGLPSLLALTSEQRSLVDRLSGSETHSSL